MEPTERQLPAYAVTSMPKYHSAVPRTGFRFRRDGVEVHSFDKAESLPGKSAMAN